MRKKVIYNFKNWKWWLVLLPACTCLFIALLIKVLIWLAEKLLCLLEFINFGDRHCKALDKITNWVDN